MKFVSRTAIIGECTSSFNATFVMSIHAVQVNNYMKYNKKCAIDSISKIFITIQWLFGLNRITILCRTMIQKALSIFFGFCIISAVTFLTISNGIEGFFPEIVKLHQYIICAVLSFVFRNKIRQYYEELVNFDTHIEARPSVNRVSVTIFISMTSICTLTIATLIIINTPIFIPIHMIQIVENHYYGFLFNLLNQRLQMINSCIEMSLLSNSNFMKSSKAPLNLIGDYKRHTMSKLMEYYYIIINAYDLLVDSIKWQLLFLITTSFVYTLCISYTIAVKILSEEADPRGYIVRLLMLAADSIPLIAPCMCCDKVRQEVHNLRELLASKLFESKLDKDNRSVARALLALTKARDLSFSLLRMVDISISLPFSFLGLMATYLIILLQFQKVINPDSRNFTLSPQNETSLVN